MKPLVSIALFASLIVGCKSKKDEIFIEIKHQLQNTPPLNIVYTINAKEVKVEIDQKKFPFGEKKTSYSKSINAKEKEDLIQFLYSKKLDTLKTSYKMLDTENNVKSLIKIKLNGKQTVNCEIQNTTVTCIDDLYNYIDNLIENPSFKLGKKNE